MIFEPQAKLLWHGDRVKQWLTTNKVNPILIEIAPTGYCNASCPWCFFKDKQGKDRIDSKVLLKALKDLSTLGLKAINWSGGGEPTLHPDFADFVILASELNFSQGLFSNGYTIIPEQDKFAWIRISLTDKGFSSIIKPEVPFGICVNHTKEHTVDILNQVCLDAKNFGANYFQIRPALIGDYLEQPLLEVPTFLLKHKDVNFEVYITDYKYAECIKAKDYLDCYGYHFCPSIDWKGNLSACLYLTLNPMYIFGNLNKQSLLSIWKILPDKVTVIPSCQNCCKNHEINKLLYKTKNLKLECFL
jgi:MoaA/NifB/PqqE/SkfB family radical SAM enzyme